MLSPRTPKDEVSKMSHDPEIVDCAVSLTIEIDANAGTVASQLLDTHSTLIRRGARLKASAVSTNIMQSEVNEIHFHGVLRRFYMIFAVYDVFSSSAVQHGLRNQHSYLLYLSVQSPRISLLRPTAASHVVRTCSCLPFFPCVTRCRCRDPVIVVSTKKSVRSLLDFNRREKQTMRSTCLTVEDSMAECQYSLFQKSHTWHLIAVIP